MKTSSTAKTVLPFNTFHHLNGANMMQQYSQHYNRSYNVPQNSPGVLSPRCVLPPMSHNLSDASQSLAAAIFASTPLIGVDLKLAAAAAAAAAAQSRGKKLHRADPVPQSGFKGVSWNSRMKAWLAFYVTENGERKSKTFSTRKLGMEEARLQAIAFCKQKQDQRREARKRNRAPLQHNCTNDFINGLVNGNLDKLSSDESILGTPTSLQHTNDSHNSMRCGYTTTPGTTSGIMTPAASQTPNSSEIAYVPIVPISVNMIEKSGLLQPLELTILPPCQHCNKQPYPFLMIVSEGQEQTYSGNSITSLTAQDMPNNLTTHLSCSNNNSPSMVIQSAPLVTNANCVSHEEGSPTSSETDLSVQASNSIYSFTV